VTLFIRNLFRVRLPYLLLIRNKLKLTKLIAIFTNGKAYVYAQILSNTHPFVGSYVKLSLRLYDNIYCVLFNCANLCMSMSKIYLSFSILTIRYKYLLWDETEEEKPKLTASSVASPQFEPEFAVLNGRSNELSGE
jgi:hypothetical protein